MSIRSRRSSAARYRQRRRYTSRLRERTRVRSPPHVPRTALTHARSFEAPSADSVLDHVQDLFDRGVEHLQGKSLAPIRDGTGLGSALPSEFVCSSPEEQSLQVLSIILDASREFGVDEAVASISGAPSPDQALLLESKVVQAAAKCSRCLASYLRCSQRSASSGSPIKVELLSALVRALRDKDVTLAQDIDHGLSLGIDRPLEPTGLFPPYSHHDQASALERFHLGIRANYKSVEMNQAVTERLIEEEVRLNRMRELSPEEAADPRRVFARMALLEKKSAAAAGPASSADTGQSLLSRYRLVEDYKRNGLNEAMHPVETVSLPALADLQRVTQDFLYALSLVPGDLPRPPVVPGAPVLPTDSQVEALTPTFTSFDISSAFRHLFMCSADRFRLSTSVNGRSFEHRAMPFGTKVAPYHWCRLGACIGRLQRELLHRLLNGVPHAFLLYVDDGLLLLPKYVSALAASVSLVLWCSLGVSLSWKKCQFNLGTIDYIGYRLSVTCDDCTIQIKPGTLENARVSLRNLVTSSTCTPQSVATVTGRLLFATQVAPFLRSFLQPLYSLLQIFGSRRLRVLHLSSSSRALEVARFWLEVVNGDRLRLPVLANSRRIPLASRSHLIVASDASLLGIGAFAAFPDGAGYYISQAISPCSIGPWRHLLDCPGSFSSADMTLLELLAAGSALTSAHCLLQLLEVSSPVYIHLYTDSSAVVGCLNKLYSPSNKLAPVLQVLASVLASIGGCLDVEHIKGEDNWLADGLSRLRVIRPPAHWKKWHSDFCFSVPAAPRTV